ncbi:uncharacterized protein ACA1_149390 [Acanthamoeba castellanii str. Neff]|uniref:Cytoplasmic tRNA 2-thiolation protein 2 n=1 Tax=Acanthamoeba castellanii (strain ATCC 30010 / Neff) TaxID=1257118 RepID=L8HED7_ACACF|nr:uncharacterized protein ACA1_149390 [Acanthamoeba castellanii str. Neff]ELR22771.1 hypothetical protein ACA1_149390 [Acanthamoeba castellanii str. Neff]
MEKDPGRLPKVEEASNHHEEEEEDDEGETPCGSAPQKKEVSSPPHGVAGAAPELEAAKGAKAGAGRRTCQKCNTAPSVFNWRNEYICWACFRNLFDKRFKTNFVKGRKNKREHVRLLLAFSGGPSSRALLHGVAQCTMGRGTKALYDVHVLHIDQSRITGIPDADRVEQQEEMKRVVESYGLRLDILPLEAVTSLPGVVPEGAVKEKEEKEEEDSGLQLQRLFDRTTTLTSREDLLAYLRTHLLASVAAQREASWVCVGDSATRIAVDMIADTCKGRAFGLPDRLSFIDTRYPGLLWVRPMKEFLAQEVALYNHFAQLSAVFIPQLDTKTSKMASINHLAEAHWGEWARAGILAFLAGLQADFPHTIHTLLRSGDKLSLPATLPSDSRHYCRFATVPDHYARACSALAPAEVKAACKASAAAPSVDAAQDSCCGGGGGCGGGSGGGGEASSDGASCGGGGGCGSSASSATRGAQEHKQSPVVVVAGLVCYGCRKLLAESEPALLPSFVGQQALGLSRSLRLREEISSYLLDDDDDGGGDEEEDAAS